MVSWSCAAGRTAPGKCVRLYGEKEFAMMDPESVPEIQRKSLEDVVLFLKNIGIDGPSSPLYTPLWLSSCRGSPDTPSASLIPRTPTQNIIL